MKFHLPLLFAISSGILCSQDVKSGEIIFDSHIGTRSYGFGGTLSFATPFPVSPRFGVKAYRIIPADSVSSNLSTSFSIGIGFLSKFYIEYEKLSEPLNYPKSLGNGAGIKIGGGHDLKFEYLPISIGGFVAYRKGNDQSNTELALQVSYSFGF